MSRWGRRSLGLLAVLFGAGCIDTALSLVVEVRSAEVAFDGADVLAVDLVVDVRVGEHALAGDDFVVPRAGILVADGDPVGEINLERPEGFVGRLEPGESTVVRVSGRSLPGAFPRARELICGGAALEVVVSWTAREQPDDPLDPPLMSMGSASIVTTDVSCRTTP